MRIKATLCILLALSLLAAWALHAGAWRVPDRWNPWSPLVIAEPPNLLTRYKLLRLSSDAALCRSVVETSAFQFQWLPDRSTGEDCGMTNVLRIERTSMAVGTAFVISCRGAVALALFERHVVQPQALQHFGQPVARLDHYGSYACRNVYGRDDARRSQHATADALDVAGFVLADGRRVGVLADWQGPSPASSFLHDVHAGACRFFDAVLGPDYNAAHRDHFHLDRGLYRACR